jgi:cobalt-zinc-cadmium efflux system outer membrane protein
VIAGVAAAAILAPLRLAAESGSVSTLPEPGSKGGVIRPLTVRLPATGVRAAPVHPGIQVSAVEQAASAPQPPEGISPGQVVASPGVTLDDATAIMLANNPSIRESRQRAISARGKALQAGLYPNPTLGTASPQLAGSETQYNAYVIQDVVTKGKIGLSAAAAERAAREAEWLLVRARFDALTAVRTRFYTALVMQRRVEVLERMVEIARSALGVSKKLLELEVGPRSDVLLLQIELAKAEAELKNGRTLAETSRSQLAAATGLIDLAIDRVEGDLQQVLPDYELIAVQQGVIARNALVRGAEMEIARSPARNSCCAAPRSSHFRIST